MNAVINLNEFRKIISRLRKGFLKVENLTKEQLLYANKNRFTVAHYLATREPSIANHTDILDVKDNTGRTVRNILEENGHLKKVSGLGIVNSIIGVVWRAQAA